MTLTQGHIIIMTPIQGHTTEVRGSAFSTMVGTKGQGTSGIMIENDLGTPGENGLGTTGKKDLTIFEDTGDPTAEDMAGVSIADLRWKQSNGAPGTALWELSSHYPEPITSRQERAGIGDRRSRVRFAGVPLVRGIERGAV